MEYALNMAKYSNEIQPNISSMCTSQKTTSPLLKTIEDESDTESFTDISSILETKSSLIDYNATPKYDSLDIESVSTMPTNALEDEQSLPDDDLVQSLVDYANSFSLESVYSIVNSRKSPDTGKLLSKSSKERRVSSSINDEKPLVINDCRRKQENYENKAYNNQPITGIKQQPVQESTSYYFPMKNSGNDNCHDYYHANDNERSEQSTTIFDESQFEWEYLPRRRDTLNKSSRSTFQSYQQTISNESRISSYVKDSEKSSSSLLPPENSCLPIIIYERSEDSTVEKNKRNNLLKQYTSLLRPAHIIIREIIYNHPSINPLNLKQKSSRLSTTSNQFYSVPKLLANPNYETIYESIPIQQNKQYPDKPLKPIIIEYDQINVTIDRTIRQRKEIKRVDPNQYIQKYGSSLYTNEVFQNILSKIVA